MHITAIPALAAVVGLSGPAWGASPASSPEAAALARETPGQKGWGREYRIASDRDLTLLYWTKLYDPAGDRRTHSLTIMAGKAAMAARAKARGRPAAP